MESFTPSPTDADDPGLITIDEIDCTADNEETPRLIVVGMC